MDVHGHELSGIAVGLEGERGIRHGLRIVNLTQDVPSLTAISLAVWGDARLQCRHNVLLLLPDHTVEHHPVEARCLALPAVAAVSHRRHSWGHANPTACGDNTRSIFGSADREGGRAFGCFKGQSRTGRPSLAAAPFLAERSGRSTEAVG